MEKKSLITWKIRACAPPIDLNEQIGAIKNGPPDDKEKL